MDKCRVRNIMDNKDCVSYIMLLSGVIWQAPDKCNTIAIEDINQSAQNVSFPDGHTERMHPIKDVQINF